MRERSRRRWFENTVLYSLDVARFAGNFAGLIDRLDYLHGLGIDTLWVLPFQRSPNRDNRYDVADFYAVDPALGDPGDVARFLQECDQRGIRVIVELIVNHTSIEHPWFLEARSDRRSPKHDYYVWCDDKPEPGGDLMYPVFPGVEDDVWTWDEEAGRYYLHRFYDFQPELNIANPTVRDEIAKIASFWLDLGVGGFRLDAAPYIVQKASWADDTNGGLWYVEELRELVGNYGDDAVLLAEADLDPDDYAKYFLDGRGINVLLNFWSNNHLFLSLAREDARPLAGAMQKLAPAPQYSSYANWVRNHDELDLEKLTEDERLEVLDRFAPRPEERIYDRGIRRRWPPMADGDRRFTQLAYAVTFALPGVPVLLYGEEIGLGDDLSLPERHAIRVDMDWRVAAEQRSDPASLLNAIQGLVRARQESPELGTGTVTVVDDVASACVLALRHQGDHYTSVVLTNFGREEETVRADVLDGLTNVTELASDVDYGAVAENARTLRIDGHGYRWFRGRHPH